MAKEHSFDIVCQLDRQEVVNAVQQTEREVGQRYDFKNAKVTVEFDQKAMTILLTGDSDFRVKSLADVLDNKLIKRNIPLAAVTKDAVDTSTNGNARQLYHLQTGIPIEKAKAIIKLIKELKIKVQAAIQSEQVRITGKALDDLQLVQKEVKDADLGVHLQYINYR